MQLTAVQYAFLLDLSRSVPRTFSTSDEEAAQDDDLVAKLSAQATPARQSSPSLHDFATMQPELDTIDLLPELAKVAINKQGEKIPLYSKLEFAFTVKTVYLELFTNGAISQASLKDNSLARFSLNESDIRYKMMAEGGSMEAEVLLRSFVSYSGVKHITFAHSVFDRLCTTHVPQSRPNFEKSFQLRRKKVIS